MPSPSATVRVVDVYPYRVADGRVPEFLLARRAAGIVYAGQWRMIGGKVDRGETAWEAALRELHEETARRPVRFWALPSVNHFYEWQRDTVALVPAFAAELDGEPVLDAEHDAFVWLPAEAAAARLAWPEQQRLLRLADALLRAGAVLPELEIPLPPSSTDRPPSS
ncbi:MAG: NUDIX domain-containing protein [Rubricoccaceae bacterium]|nr:NUDIX domain-containing protein [Rubricoccaceae bacterium]